MRTVLGIDVGGTKTHLRVDSAGSVVLDRTIPSAGWSTHIPGAAAGWLHTQIRLLAAELRPEEQFDRVAVGAHGCESAEQANQISRELSELTGLNCLMVNDAQLVVPAAGLATGIGMIAGTGSVVVGTDSTTGEHISAGGWGWVLGDEGSASALVREAARAVLRASDEGLPPDILNKLLMKAFSVTDLGSLAMVMSWDDGVETWAPHAPLIFEAAAAGSILAAEVISAGGAALARLVDLLIQRGAAGETVVAAGGVITAQPALFNAIAHELGLLRPKLRLTLLDQPPVAGAIMLAQGLQPVLAQ